MKQRLNLNSSLQYSVFGKNRAGKHCFHTSYLPSHLFLNSQINHYNIQPIPDPFLACSIYRETLLIHRETLISVKALLWLVRISQHGVLIYQIEIFDVMRHMICNHSNNQGFTWAALILNLGTNWLVLGNDATRIDFPRWCWPSVFLDP